MSQQPKERDFPVVCVGGSAGGLDAYIRLLKHLPADMGVAIVIVNHLRQVATLLHEILPRHTQMPVELITEGLVLEPNHVFIIPPQRDLHVIDGEFRLKPISKPRGWPDVITVFLRSLTDNWNGQIIAVIVSGFDGDGAAALCGIKEAGGITIAQKPETARHARERDFKRVHRLRVVARGNRAGDPSTPLLGTSRSRLRPRARPSSPPLKSPRLARQHRGRRHHLKGRRNAHSPAERRRA